MSQEGILSIAESTPTVATDFVANTGTAVPVLNTLNILGSGTISTTASGNTVTITPTSQAYPVTPYVVGPVGFAGYQTIQSALNAATAAGGGIVAVQPGTYTENLVLYGNTMITGITFADTGEGVNIVGTHTPPATGGFVFDYVNLTGTAAIFNSNAAGSAHLLIGNAAVTVSNGYTFNLPNWTGKLEVYDVNGRGGTNDGWINNTGGATVSVFSAAIGAGSLHSMILSGSVTIFDCAVGCPINCVTGCVAFIEYNLHLAPITFSNNSTGEVVLCEVLGQITMSSSAAVLIADSNINTSSNPAIAGAGVGPLTLNSLTFVSNKAISPTLVLSATGGLYPPGSLGSSGYVWTSNGAGVVPTFQTVSASGAITTITGNSGGAESPSAGNFNILGTGSITVAGSANTETIQLTGLTAHNVLLGEGTATVGLVAPSATSGIPLISKGASADPTFGTAVVAGGGTGATSFTAYAPVCGGTTTTGVLQSAATGISNSGYVLTSNGSAALPSFQVLPASGISTIDGDTGSITGSTVTIKTGVSTQNCGSSIEFVNSGTTSTLNVTDALSNTIIGSGAGNATLTGNFNTGIGHNIFQAFTTATNNTGLGASTLQATTSGSNNIAIGNSCLSTLTTGSYNLAFGLNSGGNYTGSESSNINIGNNGTPAESNVIRIGTQGSSSGQQNTCFIAGIASVSVSNTQMVTINTSTGQLGSQAMGAFAWSDNSGTFTAAASNGYFITATSTATLPASPSEGDTISFIVDTTQILTITGNTGQKIRIGSTLSAAAGTAASNARGDSIELVYRTTGTTWFASSAPQGTWTVT